MKIETTININDEILQKLNLASQKSGLSKSQIIVHLLKKIRNNSSTNFSFFKRVKYQNKNVQCKWKCFHLSIMVNDYELMMDMRKIYKMSVSFLIATAINSYLNKIYKNMESSFFKKITDNYTITHQILPNDIICWKIYWAFPGTQFILRDNSNQS